MENLKFTNLIHKQLTGEISAAEAKILKDWLNASPDNAAYAQEIEASWAASAQYAANYTPDVQKGLASFKAKMNAQPSAKVVEMPGKSRFRIPAIAAAIALLVGTAALFQVFKSETATQIASATDQLKEIKLEDGSIVWLNEQSTLEYPETFDSKRIVFLDGEAFFDIAKDANRPFIIQTHTSDVQVLGTSFNVRSFAEEHTTEVQVKTGLVRFSKDEQGINLTANETGVYNAQTNAFSNETNAATLNADSWKTGELTFIKTPLAKVVEDLEAHFEVAIEFDVNNAENCTFTSPVPLTTLTAVLDGIQGTTGIQIEKVNNKKILFNGKCN